MSRACGIGCRGTMRRMTRTLPWAGLGLGCTLALVLACFWPVLFRDGQFAHFDAAFFYYPLYLRVQQEWAAGRWPLWEPGQNGGMPLLGNPVAAVLYPGKAVFGLFPYAWGLRLYVIGHVLVALVGMVALARSLELGGVGSILSGLTYAFGAPLLLQYGNPIFLVGAAWIPWGLRAIDRLQRCGRRIATAELAAILALQVLGGDPEAAYLTVVCGAGYGVLLAIRGGGWPARIRTRATTLGVLAVWAGATLG